MIVSLDMNFRSLVSEDNDSISIGRISFWVLFGLSIYFWIMKPTFPQTLYDTLGIILLYNFGKKGIDVANNFVDKIGKA